MKLRIAIDGACRRNGKEDCVASGGVFIMLYNDMGTLLGTMTKSGYELRSTNQRGELLALKLALSYIDNSIQVIDDWLGAVQIITDSEYIYNAMTKEWFVGWESRDWRTASNDVVKNSDLWKDIQHLYESCKAKGVDIVFYHIKGHCIPFGKVTANTLLSKDTSGELLKDEVDKKYDSVATTTKKEVLMKANELSLKNNGFRLEPEFLKEFVVMNTVVDAIATRCVDAADALMD